MTETGKLRIIAGHWRGRKLDVVDAPGLRPTPDRMRETLFNWLQFEVVAARCLDLFAGTGALGFEALSRDAREVVMIEANATAVKNLQQQAEQLHCDNISIYVADAVDWIRQATDGFDIIFLDPPFYQDYVEPCCELIKQRALLNRNGLLYVESEKGLSINDDWEIKKQTRAGEVQAMLLELKTGNTGE